MADGGFESRVYTVGGLGGGDWAGEPVVAVVGEYGGVEEVDHEVARRDGPIRDATQICFMVFGMGSLFLSDSLAM